MSEPLTTGAVIGVLVILIGKSVYSISKRIKKSKCTNGGVEMSFENQDCPEKQKREHKRHHRRKHRRDPLKHKNKAKTTESETKLKKL
jgi:hypothetical protein